MIPLAEMKKKRTQFMHRVYERSEGSEHRWLNMWQVGEELGFGGMPSKLTLDVVQYLKGESLIKFQANGGVIGITHWGIKEVEASLENPEQPTEHFAPLATINIVHVNSMVNSQIQQSGSSSTQSATLNSNQISDLREIIAELSALSQSTGLTTDQKDELTTEIDTLLIQAKSAKPKAQRIKESLVSARNILEGAAVGGVLITRITGLLVGIPS